SFVRPDHKSNIVTTTPTVPTKSEVPPSSQLDDESVIKKQRQPLPQRWEIRILSSLNRWSGLPGKTSLENLSTPFAASSRTKPAEPNRLYFSSKKKRRTSAATL